MFNCRYVYFIALFAIAFLLSSFPAWANNSPAVQTSAQATAQALNIPSWLGLGGGAGASASLGFVAKAKLDKILQNPLLTSSVKETGQNYTNSFAYLKDKLKVLASELLKSGEKIEKLNRRFSYVERQLLKSLNNYQSYDDYKHHKMTQ